MDICGERLTLRQTHPYAHSGMHRHAQSISDRDIWRHRNTHMNKHRLTHRWP